MRMTAKKAGDAMKSNFVMPQEEIEKTMRRARKLRQGKTGMKQNILQNIRDLLMKTKKY